MRIFRPKRSSGAMSGLLAERILKPLSQKARPRMPLRSQLAQQLLADRALGDLAQSVVALEKVGQIEDLELLDAQRAELRDARGQHLHGAELQGLELLLVLVELGVGIELNLDLALRVSSSASFLKCSAARDLCAWGAETWLNLMTMVPSAAHAAGDRRQATAISAGPRRMALPLRTRLPLGAHGHRPPTAVKSGGRKAPPRGERPVEIAGACAPRAHGGRPPKRPSPRAQS